MDREKIKKAGVEKLVFNIGREKQCLRREDICQKTPHLYRVEGVSMANHLRSNMLSSSIPEKGPCERCLFPRIFVTDLHLYVNPLYENW